MFYTCSGRGSPGSLLLKFSDHQLCFRAASLYLPSLCSIPAVGGALLALCSSSLVTTSSTSGCLSISSFSMFYTCSGSGSPGSLLLKFSDHQLCFRAASLYLPSLCSIPGGGGALLALCSSSLVTTSTALGCLSIFSFSLFYTWRGRGSSGSLLL
jgi:hypothetical protein